MFGVEMLSVALALIKCCWVAKCVKKLFYESDKFFWRLGSSNLWEIYHTINLDFMQRKMVSNIKQVFNGSKALKTIFPTNFIHGVDFTKLWLPSKFTVAQRLAKNRHSVTTTRHKLTLAVPRKMSMLFGSTLIVT